MKKLLITGFEPFGGETVNPSWQAVCRLPDMVNGYALIKRQLPVVFEKSAAYVVEEADAVKPDVILCIGQAGGRSAITPEMVGINLRHGGIPDNGGYRPQDEPIIPDGACAYFSTIPVRRIAEAVSSVGIPSQVSYSAGAYVCNDVLYTLLARFQGTSTRVGFIHVPYAEGQSKTPCMELDRIVQGLIVAIEHLDA